MKTCQRLKDAGIVINRPPRDDIWPLSVPDNISIELLQKGDPLPKARAMLSAPNIGHW